MITVRLAKRSDVPSIRYLMHKYSKFTISEKHINHRDVSIVAHDDEGKCVGFVWVGCMAGNTVGYIDKFCIDPDYAGKKVGAKLAHKAISEGIKRGIRECFGVIRRDKYHERCGMNALKSAMCAHSDAYTYVCADSAFMRAELKASGVEV